MRKLQIVFGILLVGVLALAACSGSQTADDVMSEKDNMMENSSDEMMEDKDSMGEMDNTDNMEDNSHDSMEENDNSDAAMPEEPADSDDAMSSLKTPAWFDYEFTDAVTGQTFTINGFKGKVVLVETLAMWCSNCLKQQKQVKELHNLLGERDDFIGIGVDVDLNEDLGQLGNYVSDNGFDWLYGVASEDVLAEISTTLGGQFLNPPSTPIVLIDKEGVAHPLPFGIKSAAELLAFVETYLN